MDVNNNSDDEYIENIENIEETYQLHNQERVTKPVMTIYEKAKILGARAVQISRNAPIFVNLNSDDTDPLTIAEKELRENKLPFIIRRYMPDGKYEEWLASELKIE